MAVHRRKIVGMQPAKRVPRRAFTRTNEPGGFVRSLAKMARWESQFDYSNLDELIAALRKTNALEESPATYKLLNVDGSPET